VVWTDAVQMLILLVGLIALVVLGSTRVGGLAQVWSTAVDTGRINFDECVQPRAASLINASAYRHAVGPVDIGNRLLPYSLT